MDFIRPANMTVLLLENLGLRRSPFDQRAWVSHPEVPAAEARRYRSLPLRHLDCGSCHGCELSLLRLENPIFDIKQYNSAFEAAARSAFVLVATGPWTRNTMEAAQLNLAGMSVPAVVAFGDCPIDGGPFAGSYAVAAPGEVIKDRFIVDRLPGCPPDPFTAERHFLALFAKLKEYQKSGIWR
jgi:Ni,Fe-hydrogenase III small subunit